MGHLHPPLKNPHTGEGWIDVGNYERYRIPRLRGIRLCHAIK